MPNSSKGSKETSNTSKTPTSKATANKSSRTNFINSNETPNPNKNNHTKATNSNKTSNANSTKPTPHSNTSTKDKDSQATRILLIIKALINGKDLKALSEKDFDFRVSKRTFQRDIKMIKDFFSENAALQGGACKVHSKVRHT